MKTILNVCVMRCEVIVFLFLLLESAARTCSALAVCDGFLSGFLLPDHHGEHGGHHHDHVHDSSVTSVSIVSEGTLDLDEVAFNLLLYVNYFSMYAEDFSIYLF